MNSQQVQWPNGEERVLCVLCPVEQLIDVDRYCASCGEPVCYQHSGGEASFSLRSGTAVCDVCAAMRAGGMLSRLPHKQETVGSSPTPATSSELSAADALTIANLIVAEALLPRRERAA